MLAEPEYLTALVIKFSSADFIKSSLPLKITLLSHCMFIFTSLLPKELTTFCMSSLRLNFSNDFCSLVFSTSISLSIKISFTSLFIAFIWYWIILKHSRFCSSLLEFSESSNAIFIAVIGVLISCDAFCINSFLYSSSCSSLTICFFSLSVIFFTDMASSLSNSSSGTSITVSKSPLAIFKTQLSNLLKELLTWYISWKITSRSISIEKINSVIIFIWPLTIFSITFSSRSVNSI